jgi:hypothetical protein
MKNLTTDKTDFLFEILCVLPWFIFVLCGSQSFNRKVEEVEKVSSSLTYSTSRFITLFSSSVFLRGLCGLRGSSSLVRGVCVVCGLSSFGAAA